MEAPEAQPIKWTTEEILAVLAINKKGARNGIQEDMLTEPKVIGHLNDEDAEIFQAACIVYAKRTLANRRFIVTRVQQKRLTSLVYWVKDQGWLVNTNEISINVDEPTLRTMIEEFDER